MKTHSKVMSFCCGLLALAGCATYEPMPTVEYVDLERFMGDWYVIAAIPTFIERGAHNAIESYRLDSDGAIDTTFTFRDGNFDGETKVYHPRGYVRAGRGNAVWGMQFIWPFKADFRIVYLSDDYTHTIIGRNKRDYVWMMARTPSITAHDYRHMLKIIAALGYNPADLQRVPQQW